MNGARHLDMVGALYLTDPTLASELLAALDTARTASPGEFYIRQQWLNCHWEHPEAFAALVEISDLYNRAPEPLPRFLEYCWRHQLVDWHHFIPFELGDLEPSVFAQFAREGPTDDVLESIHFLGRRPAYDEIVWDLISQAIQAPAPHPTGLILWRITGPLPDRYVTPGALSVLEDLLVGDHALLQGEALRVCTCLKMSQVAPMLGAIALLAHTRTRARRIILGMGGHGRYKARVASAVKQHGWHEYLTGGHRNLLYELLDMLQEHRRWDVFLGLYDSAPYSAVGRGVFTRLMENCTTLWEDIPQGYCCLWTTPTSVHSAVHYMYYQGQVPPFAHYFNEALQAHPDAVANIAKRAPLVRKEVRWAHMKLLVCCLPRRERPAKRAKAGARDVLLALARHPESWPIVLGFLY